MSGYRTSGQSTNETSNCVDTGYYAILSVRHWDAEWEGSAGFSGDRFFPAGHYCLWSVQLRLFNAKISVIWRYERLSVKSDRALPGGIQIGEDRVRLW